MSSTSVLTNQEIDLLRSLGLDPDSDNIKQEIEEGDADRVEFLLQKYWERVR
jgi:hypothetical protein